MMSVERKFAALKILWERHIADEFNNLIDLIKVETTDPATGAVKYTVREIDESILRNLFDQADRSAWGRLKDAIAKHSLTIVAPSMGDANFFESYDPIRFEIQTDDPTLNKTYLFKHGLDFQWTFTLEYSGRWLKMQSPFKSQTISWMPCSTEPRVVQYAPHGGTLSAKVRIKKYGESVPLPAEGAPADKMPIDTRIVACADFGTLRGLAKVEVFSWTLAAIVAIVTGLSTFYFKGSTFGSFQDYISLFLWGIGVEQGKNFLQTLQAYSAKP
jgi:hypothetical protein